MPSEFMSSEEVTLLRKVDPSKSKSVLSRIRSYSKCSINRQCFAAAVTSFFPTIAFLNNNYSLRAFSSDVIAGTTMGIFNVPQGMAYGILTGLSPVNGLYVSFYCPLIYFLFGVSRHLAVGTFAVICLLLSNTIVSMSEEHELLQTRMLNHTRSLTENLNYRVEVSIALTFLAGIFQLVFGIFRLGFLLSYMPTPMLRGFTCACGFYVALSQLDAILGIRSARAQGYGQFVKKLINFFSVIKEINLVTLSISIGSIFFLVVSKELTLKLVDNLQLVIAGLISYVGDLNQTQGVKIIGVIPYGLPAPSVPNWGLFLELIPHALQLGFLSYAISSSITKHYATEYHYPVNFNQEWIAFGLMNVICAPLNCFAGAGSLARTAICVD
ncbi:hypothetical protein Ciccas_009678, partial [Cichlidogyrus casuarinus]